MKQTTLRVGPTDRSIQPRYRWQPVGQVVRSEAMPVCLGALMGLTLLLNPVMRSGIAAQIPDHTDWRDTTLFGAILEAIPATAVWGAFEVYLPPYDPDLGFSGRLDADARAHADLASRVHAIESRSLRITDSIDVTACPGLLAAEEINPGCPTHPRTRIAVSLPREVDGDSVPHWKGGGRYAGRKADAVVHLLFVSESPRGSMVSSAEYYAVRDEFGWEVVARRVIAIIH